MNVEEEYLTLGRTFVLSNGYSLAVFHFSVCTRCSLNQSIKGPCHLISWVSATFPCFSSRLRSVWRESECDLEWVGILTTLRTEPLFQVDDRKNNMKYFYSFRKSETTLKHENELESLTPIHSTLLERYQESNCYFFFFFWHGSEATRNGAGWGKCDGIWFTLELHQWRSLLYLFAVHQEIDKRKIR